MEKLTKNGFEDVEKYRLELEANVTKLRKALQHWQIWEAEYEGLKEELQTLPSDDSGENLIKTARGAQGELVNKKEIDELLGHDKRPPRSAIQVVALTSRRIEYVHRNVETLQKQVDAAELQIADILVVNQSDAITEKGLPVTEIHEELDEDGNVLCGYLSNILQIHFKTDKHKAGKTVRHGEAASEVLGVLKKAGIKEADLGDANDTSSRKSNEQVPHTDAKAIEKLVNDEIPTAPADVLADEGHVSEHVARPRKKSVSFAEGTKEAHDANKSTPDLNFLPMRETSVSNKGSTSGQSATGSGSIISDNNDGNAGPTPVIPTDESPEDAALRREMLQYHMSEVGSIVAQLDLDENEGSNSEYNDDDDEMELDSTSLTDEEDQYGMSTNRGLDDDYTAKMMELEKKLGAQMFQNVGPEGVDNHTADPLDEERSSILKKENDIEIADTPVKEKSVRFADKLDVAPTTLSVQKKNEPKYEISTTTPISATVVERPMSNATSTTSLSPTRKPSRFKAARAATAATTSSNTNPTDPPSTPLASSIIERPPSVPDSSARPSSPDEFDPVLVRQQVATEYYRQRNRMIQKEGGFSRRRQEEQEMEEYDPAEEEAAGDNGGIVYPEEEDDEPEPEKKVSLFKAARLKKAGIR